MYEPSQFHGRILDSERQVIGTCFQIESGILVTANHVAKAAVVHGRDTVWVLPLDAPSESSPSEARVIREDPDHDLAILRTETPLPASAPQLCYSDSVQPGTQAHMTGAAILAEVEGPAPYRCVSTNVSWEGAYVRDDGRGLRLARGEANGTEPGMSGCAVLHRSDNAVMGVLSGRYNSIDDWSRNRAVFSRTEDLAALLSGIAEVPIENAKARTYWDARVQLAETSLGRASDRLDESFVLPPDWHSAWESGKAAVNDGDVLVVAAQPGVGATTFVEQLLAHQTPNHILAHFDPGDWDKPVVPALRPKPKHTYILDLRDPEHDVPTDSFLTELGRIANWYKDLQSRLVITIRERLWRKVAGQADARIRTVHLERAPDAQELVESYISRKAPDLAPMVLPAIAREEVAKHLSGMNAVQAASAAETILRVSSGRTGEHRTLDALAKRILEEIDSHTEELDQLFGENVQALLSHRSDSSSQMIRPLATEDRCLLLALACRERVNLSTLENDSRRLMDKLHESRHPAGAPSPYDALSGPGLRGRLRRIGASISQGDNVRLDRPSFANATVRYAWENYTAIRSPLSDWLIELAAEENSYEQRAAELLGDLVMQSEELDFVRSQLASIAIGKGQTTVLAKVLVAMISDSHFRRRCERLLYDWAGSTKPELQMVVVLVSRKILGTERYDIALRRLRRVADSGRAAEETLSAVGETFSYAMEQPEVRPRFLDSLRGWLSAGLALDSTSARLAFGAAVQSKNKDVPWILSAEAAAFDATTMVGGLFADSSGREAIVSLVRRAGADDEVYRRVIELLARSAAASGALAPLLNMAAELREVGIESGRDPVNDLCSGLRLAEPPKALSQSQNQPT